MTAGAAAQGVSAAAQVVHVDTGGERIRVAWIGHLEAAATAERQSAGVPEAYCG